MNGNEISRILDGIAEGIDVQRVSIEQAETRPSNHPSTLQPVSVRLGSSRHVAPRFVSLIARSIVVLFSSSKKRPIEKMRPIYRGRDAERCVVEFSLKESATTGV